MAGDKHGLMLPVWFAERYDGTYLDGRRFDDCASCSASCLKPDRSRRVHVFKEFDRLVHRAASPPAWPTITRRARAAARGARVAVPRYGDFTSTTSLHPAPTHQL